MIYIKDTAGRWVLTEPSFHTGSGFRPIEQAYLHKGGRWVPLYEYSWATTPWGPCDSPCGQGNQYRSYSCTQGDGYTSRTVDNGLCSRNGAGAPPPTTQVCYNSPCLSLATVSIATDCEVSIAFLNRMDGAPDQRIISTVCIGTVCCGRRAWPLSSIIDPAYLNARVIYGVGMLTSACDGNNWGDFALDSGPGYLVQATNVDWGRGGCMLNSCRSQQNATRWIAYSWGAATRYVACAQGGSYPCLGGFCGDGSIFVFAYHAY